MLGNLERVVLITSKLDETALNQHLERTEELEKELYTLRENPISFENFRALDRVYDALIHERIIKFPYFQILSLLYGKFQIPLSKVYR